MATWVERTDGRTVVYESCATPEGLVARYVDRDEAIDEAIADGAHVHEEENANGPGIVYVECNDAACSDTDER